MKTLEQIKEEYAIEKGYNDWFELSQSIPGEEVCDLIVDPVAKRYVEEVAHIIVNDALRKHGIGSNTSAEFVNKWIESNLPKHR